MFWLYQESIIKRLMCFHFCRMKIPYTLVRPRVKFSLFKLDDLKLIYRYHVFCGYTQPSGNVLR